MPTFSCPAAIQQNLGGIGNEVQQIIHAAAVLYKSPTPCEGDSDNSCPCLGLQASLKQLLRKAAQQKPGLDVLLELFVHVMLTSNSFGAMRHRPHAAATKLAIADPYYLSEPGCRGGGMTSGVLV
jgi:hypothetical protein